MGCRSPSTHSQRLLRAEAAHQQLGVLVREAERQALEVRDRVTPVHAGREGLRRKVRSHRCELRDVLVRQRQPYATRRRCWGTGPLEFKSNDLLVLTSREESGATTSAWRSHEFESMKLPQSMTPNVSEKPRLPPNCPGSLSSISKSTSTRSRSCPTRCPSTWLHSLRRSAAGATTGSSSLSPNSTNSAQLELAHRPARNASSSTLRRR